MIDPSNLQASKLTKNPLGIIGLFIVLVYGIAGLVFSTSGSEVGEFERKLLVLFLVIFPVLVLFCFVWLVSRHHTKLYAPSDFQNDASFIQLTPEEQKEKVEVELNEIRNELPDIKDAVESDIRESLISAEELVLRDLEVEFGVSINRQVRFERFSLDGIFALEGAGYGIEVKYFKEYVSKNRVVDSLRNIEESMQRLHWKNFRIVFAIVVDDLEVSNPIKNDFNLLEVVSVFPFRVDLKVYGIKQLSEKYGRINA